MGKNHNSQHILLGIDLTGIQQYIFASNRLIDVAGGSLLVKQATDTEGWIKELLPDGASIIMAAGGNAVIEFTCGKTAVKNFVSAYTRKLIEEAPGLEAAIAFVDVEERGFVDSLQKLIVKLAETKTRYIPSLYAPGFGITARCGETGFPAIQECGIRNGQPISANIAARRKYYQSMQNSFDYYKLPEFKNGEETLQAVFPVEADNMGRSSGEKSLCAVVHVDGNGIGEKLSAWMETLKNSSSEAFITKYKELSERLNKITIGAMSACIDKVLGAIHVNDKNRWVLCSKALNKEFELTVESGMLNLPLRPILIGGDDLTFICDGRIAHDLAETALTHFSDQVVEEFGEGEKIGACAGVAVVHTRAPFYRAYKIAEALCSSAKAKLRDNNNNTYDTSDCAMDWHMGMIAPNMGIDNLRKNHYRGISLRGTNRIYTLRPYVLGQAGDDKVTWNVLSRELLGDRESAGLRGKIWGEMRSKVKGHLSELIKGDSEELNAVLSAWNAELPIIGGMTNGYVGDNTPYIDAIEIMDIYWPLDGKDDHEDKEVQE